MSDNRIQFRRGTTQEYITDLSIDDNDIYFVGGYGGASQDNSPLKLYVGNEPVQSVLDEDVTVTSKMGSYDAGSNIPSGTSVVEILKSILTNEMGPAPATKPSITAGHVDNDSTAIDINNRLELVTIQGATNQMSMPRFLVSKIAGHFNSTWSGNPLQPTPIYTSDKISITMDVTSGFGGYEEFASVTSQGNSAYVSATSVNIMRGQNNVNYTASYTYSSPSNKPIYNTGATYDVQDNCTWTTGIASHTVNTTIIGVYPVYTNGRFTSVDGDITQSTNDNVYIDTNIITNNYTSGAVSDVVIGFGHGQPDGLNYKTRIIEVPSNMTLVSQNQWYSFEHSYSGECHFVKTGTITRDMNGVMTSYDIYSWNTTNGPNTVKLTFRTN